MVKKIVRLLNNISPIDIDAKDIDISGFGEKNIMSLVSTGHKRTRRFAMLIIRGNLNLPDALAAAYIQGMNDAVELTTIEESVQ